MVKITYGAARAAAAAASELSPMLRLPKRLSMSGKKASLGKTSSASPFVKKSMMKKRSVVARQHSQKTYRPSPVQDSKRRGSGGLLSRLALHAARRDGK